jgi:hypothetical protein
MLQQLSHDVIVPLGSASNQSLDFPLNENENKHNFTGLGLRYFIWTISHISVNVFKCVPAFSELELPNGFCYTKLRSGLIS